MVKRLHISVPVICHYQTSLSEILSDAGCRRWWFNGTGKVLEIILAVT
jgi:hypothetical protein